jgi:hypothetical protein
VPDRLADGVGLLSHGGDGSFEFTACVLSIASRVWRSTAALRLM